MVARCAEFGVYVGVAEIQCLQITGHITMCSWLRRTGHHKYIVRRLELVVSSWGQDMFQIAETLDSLSERLIS